MSSVDHICKQFGPRADENVGPGLDTICLTLMVLLERVFRFEKDNFEQKNNSMQSYLVGKVLIENRLNIKGTAGGRGLEEIHILQIFTAPPPH